CDSEAHRAVNTGTSSVLPALGSMIADSNLMRLLSAAAAGGLVMALAPGALAPAVRTVIVKEKDRDTAAEIQNGGLGWEWVYLNADMGVAYTDLVSLKASNWQLQDNSATGLAFGIGAGVRLLFLTLGVRARDLAFPTFNMWETDLEAALHFRIWRVDMAIGARGGYAFLGSFSANSLQASSGSTPSDVTVHGWNVGPTAAVDVYLSKLVSVGVDANA